jgi:tetratricopeptide (TPR) repeat protein
VGEERQWLARAQLGGLLVAEWRLDEARGVYASAGESVRPHLAALSQFGRHEVAVLTEDPDEERLQAIRRDRDSCLIYVPAPLQADVAAAWNALEGLCLVRMGRAREAVGLLEQGLSALTYNPAREAYEHIGERRLAAERYAEATQAFPGTRLASEAASRAHALAPGAHEGFFRGMLPEAPAPGSPGPDGSPGSPRKTGDEDPSSGVA